MKFKNLTCNALKITLSLRFDRTFVFMSCFVTALRRPLKSVGGAVVRVPMYSSELNASMDNPNSWKRCRKNPSGDSSEVSETNHRSCIYGIINTTRCKYFDPCYARATVVRARFLAAAFSDGSYLAHVNGAYLRHVTFCIVRGPPLFIV